MTLEQLQARSCASVVNFYNNSSFLTTFNRYTQRNITMSKSKSKFQVKSRIWITAEDGTYLGEGRIALLKEIQLHGSISKAAKEMGMSYKKAWRLVDSMNGIGSDVLVKRTTGGKGGGGTQLSDAGLKAIELFTELRDDNHKYLDKKMAQIDFPG